ncbi:MAG: HEAT repeat domain-containing protein, partial [Thermodesulfobacteriota bacterium]|nr:HEAT repeat domain-containing protein [Thermodesulfobacteriota bacterium]
MSLKTHVRRLLADNDRKGLVSLLLDDRRVVTALNRLIFDADELIRWRAVTALGWVAEEDPFLLEKIIGRLIYTMNDDSGSIGWTAPQALGEICANDPDLVEDFFSIVISAANLPVFRRGVVWAIGRVAPVRPDLVEDTGPLLVRCLSDHDPDVRGEACRSWAQPKRPKARQEIERLISDQNELMVYEAGELVNKTVGRMAE